MTSPTQISARTPALPAGTLANVVVTNPGPDGVIGTLSSGYVANFNDVPQTNTFHPYVTTLVRNGITAGIGGGNYGVANPTLRQQMAVFLLKGKYGICYVPPPCTGVFSDVPCTPGSGFGDWIEELAAQGITGGCGTGVYCPLNPVRRDQMAVFLLKAKHGSTYVPPRLRRRLHRRRVPFAVRGLDRAARGGGDHHGLRRHQLLPAQPQHARADGGVHRRRRSTCSSASRQITKNAGREAGVFP